MKYSLLLFLFLSADLAFSQHILIKKDGQYVPYKKLKDTKKYLEAIQENKVKVIVPKKEVIAYFDGDLKKVFYKKPVVGNNEKLLFALPEDSIDQFQIVERVKVGKVTLYKKEVTGGSGAGSTSIFYYYAEKENEFRNVFITGWGSKRDDLEDLRSILGDDPEISERIDASDFRLTEKSMLNIITEYNVKNFEKPEANEYGKTGMVVFYASVGETLKSSISLKVNDSIEYKMPLKHPLLSIKLPLNVPSKICVTWQNGTSCELVQPIPFVAEPYELKYFLVDRSFEITKRSALDLKSYIIMTRN